MKIINLGREILLLRSVGGSIMKPSGTSSGKINSSVVIPSQSKTIKRVVLYLLKNQFLVLVA
jgi:hypothetical protein